MFESLSFCSWGIVDVIYELNALHFDFDRKTVFQFSSTLIASALFASNFIIGMFLRHKMSVFFSFFKLQTLITYYVADVLYQ